MSRLFKDPMEVRMLSPEKRQQIEREAVSEVRRYHRQINPTTFSSVIDDIRHKVIEEGWYGRQVTGNIGSASISYDSTHEVSYSENASNTFYGGPVTGWTAEPGAASAEAEAAPQAPASIEPHDQKPQEPEPPEAQM